MRGSHAPFREAKTGGRWTCLDSLSRTQTDIGVVVPKAVEDVVMLEQASKGHLSATFLLSYNQLRKVNTGLYVSWACLPFNNRWKETNNNSRDDSIRSKLHVQVNIIRFAAFR